LPLAVALHQVPISSPAKSAQQFVLTGTVVFNMLCLVALMGMDTSMHNEAS
ncbi:hypothetical protein ACJX0J_017103, partial [Zea mays]